MKIRRCAVLYIEPREELAVDWSSLFAGSTTLAASTRWLALAPHLDREIEVDAADLAAMAAVSQTVWSEMEAGQQRHGAARITRLLDLGLLVGDAPEHVALRERDETLRAQHWRPLAALAHTFSRWHDVRTETGMEAPTFQQLLERYGTPPGPTMDAGSADGAVRLPLPASGILDETMMKRYTGRNFDTGASLSLAVASRLLQRTFGAQETRQVGPHSNVLKKTVPSGGGLHPVEAFVLAQRVDGVAPGLYYYHPTEHELRPLRTMERDTAAALAMQMVAEQQWLAEAPMQVVMVGRIERSFWKYRNHQKAYRALALDAGHLSQTFYLLAAEAGLPAFITAAINDVDIERMLDLDHLRHAVIAVCGCGPASTGPRNMVELRYGETGLG
ncbi:putative peptide maturation dehydrogenase [Duganella hordei]|uniref:putative peptide maturation dehydrogenase n=1 Tax=Duganella hordei TaxID=2865934 RepID=UPI0030E990A4